jgi:transcriptional regulator with XRE-family HTH domain
MAKKAPTPIDKHVGSRVRMRRMMLGVSQEKLGDALGLTFQQVQKYEKGSNRIGASRLQQIALVLQAPVSFFFEGAPAPPMQPGALAAPVHADHATGLLSTIEGLALARAFMRIPSVKLRRRIVELVEEVAAQGMEQGTAQGAAPGTAQEHAAEPSSGRG